MTAPLALADGARGPHAWVGPHPPMAATSLMPADATNHRLAPEHHGAYRTVWVFERPLHSHQPWELLLDECVRLLGDTGVLVLRLAQSEGLSVFAVKRHLARNPFLDVGTESESRDTTAGDVFTIALTVARRHFPAYQDRRWTVGVLTSGADAGGAARFLRSVRRALGTREAELLVVGPEHPELAEFEVRHVGSGVGLVHPEIALKKNLLLEAATNSNVLISHARFEVAADFFDRFEEWGYDYDVATCLQTYEDGTPYPSYSAMPTRELRWQDPIEVRDLNVLLPGQYINGGLLILKKHVGEIGLCPVLFHNQAEDVEFSFALRERGVVPRVNHLATAVTFGVTPDYTRTFQLWDALPALSGSRAELVGAWTTAEEEFVDVLYAALLRRPASPTEKDAALSRLEQGGSRFRLACELAVTPSRDVVRRVGVLVRVAGSAPVRRRAGVSIARRTGREPILARRRG